MPVDVCIIGLGYMGKIHLEKLMNLEDARVSAIVDIDREKHNEISQRYKIPFFYDFKDVLGSIRDIRGAVISSPTVTHYEIARYFIENGVHVFIEKPMAKDPDESLSLVEMAKKNNVIMQIGHLERFNPAFKKALEFIKSPKMIEARRISPYTGRSTDVDVIYDLMIHDIDLMLSIMKDDLNYKVNGYGRKVLNDSFDIATGIVECENGTIGIFHANRVASKRERSFSIYDEDKIIYIDLLQHKVSVLNTQEKVPEITEYNTEKTDAVLEELKEFIHSIYRGAIPTVKGEDGLMAIKMAELIRSSIDT